MKITGEQNTTWRPELNPKLIDVIVLKWSLGESSCAVGTESHTPACPAVTVSSCQEVFL